MLSPFFAIANPCPAPPGCRPANRMTCGLAHWTPRVHSAPPCYQCGGPHDIAAALYDEPTRLWHLMAGCWSAGGWQHMTSTDLVSWRLHGEPFNLRVPGACGAPGTGGMVHDDDGTIVAYGGPCFGNKTQFWAATDATAESWTARAAYMCGDANGCSFDPHVWKAGDGRWYAMGCPRPPPAPAPLPVAPAVASFATSDSLLGEWRRVEPSFLRTSDSLAVPGHNMTHEFVSIDFFQNVSGDPTNATSVFLTSTYGPKADAWQDAGGVYSYAVFVVGSQPGGAGTPFVPRHSQPIDWSPFTPHAETPGGLDVADAWGPTQFGCCPKTVADTAAGADGRPRRVMLGWMQNGNSAGSSPGLPGTDSHENSLTLPRDLSMAPDGTTLLQRFVPELQKLRRGSGAPALHLEDTPFPPSGLLPLAVSGAQLEISATIGFASSSSSSSSSSASSATATAGAAGIQTDGASFGLAVLAGAAERTAIVLHIGKSQVWIDRRASSANGSDADVRAGPLPTALGRAGQLRLHAFVDHSIVSVIVENQTALTTWVHPLYANSTGVALLNSGGGPAPMLVSMDIWELDDA